MSDSGSASSQIIGRKVFSSNLAHLSLVFFWMSMANFHGAYFSNYSAWLKDPKHCSPSAHIVWSLVGQDILNADVGTYYFQGIDTGSNGLFQLWRSSGMVCQLHLKYASACTLMASWICLAGAYFHYHIAFSPLSKGSFYKKFRSIGVHQFCLLAGLGSISWAGHQVHIAVPLNRLLDARALPIGTLTQPDINSFWFAHNKVLNPSTSSVFLSLIAAHHFYVGVTLIIAGILAGFRSRRGLTSISSPQTQS
jgi:photosystem I P700 chlorophyll a apoprotein A1